MQLHGQVADVSLLMHQNIADLNERGNKLDDLFDKTEQFEADVSLILLCFEVIFCKLTLSSHCHSWIF